jgi:hypothetical protein
MRLDIFRRNMSRTAPIKGLKAGLRVASKNKTRTAVAYHAVNLSVSTGQMVECMRHYILGTAVYGAAIQHHAEGHLSDIGSELLMLCKVLKLKTPAVTKKVRLKGSRGVAMLEFASLANDLVSIGAESVFAVPEMTTMEKVVVLPSKGGKKEKRVVKVVDKVKDAALESERWDLYTSLAKKMVDLYWRLCLDMTGMPPVGVLTNKAMSLPEDFPELEFEQDPTLEEAVKA